MVDRRASTTSSSTDTASLGSQTDETTPLATTPSADTINKKPLPGQFMTGYLGHSMKRSANFALLPRSRLIAPMSIPNNAPLKRRIAIPMSNRAANPPTNDPLQFDLRNFAFTILPDTHSDYARCNDDLVFEHYEPSKYSYSGSQRKGISEPFPDSASYEAHIRSAVKATFPLFSLTPLPADLVTSLEFNRDNKQDCIAHFRRPQMKFLRVIAAECAHETERWYSFDPQTIRVSPNRIHIALLAHLTRFTRMGGANWLMQFTKCFPISGELCQKDVFPTENCDPPELFVPESLFETKTARFRARAPKSTSRLSQQLWGEAIEQVEKGRLNPPEPLDSDGNFIHRPLERFNLAFRFGVSQADKLRGCDDFKDSLTNMTCRVQSPITLPGWDHIASATRSLSATRQSWAFGKIDHRAAYKALPLRPTDSDYAIIALWNPKTRTWHGFRPKTQLFGSTAAVLHYNCLSRIIASMACRLLHIPTVGYFDDFGFLCNAREAPLVMTEFTAFFLSDFRTRTES